MSLSNVEAIEALINKITHKENIQLKELNIIFCQDNFLLQINKDFLKRDYLTDIITFQYDEENYTSGEMYISVDRVKENSKQYLQEFEKELNRVMIHGVLHICGYDDHENEDIRIMRKKEDEYLELLNSIVSRGT